MAQDYTQAVFWYRKAAEQGDASAQDGLGEIYDNGYGVRQDYAQAVAWYRKAADQGFPPAQTDLGIEYANGHGVPQDYVRAHMWFNLAASGAGVASFREQWTKYRDEMAAKMTPDQIAEAQRLASEWKPTK